MNTVKTRLILAAICGFVPLTLAQKALADFNLVQNGDFESTTPLPAGNPSNGDGGQLGYNINATDWTSSGYNMLFTSAAAADNGAGVNNVNGPDNVQLWGPGNGSNNGLTDSPTGGNFVSADGAYDVGPISQTISGLTVGNVYAVSFYWAGAQQYGFDGPNTEQWQVSLGAQTQSTAVYSNDSHGFSGWMQQTFSFTADSPSDVLSFLAIGTPSGVPPFSLLDGVSMSAVAAPEPSSYVGGAVILVAFGGASLWRRRTKKAA